MPRHPTNSRPPADPRRSPAPRRAAASSRPSASRRPSAPRRQSAFTFIEVLFAVILLGIGFIMIAAVFPVAIQQTSAVSDEAQGTLLARDAIKKIQSIAAAAGSGATNGNSLFPATLNSGNVPAVMSFSYNLTQAIGVDSIYSADRRYGWVGFYRRDSATSPFAQVFVIALQNPNFANYSTRFTPGESTPLPPTTTLLPTVAPPIPPNLYNYATPSVAPALGSAAAAQPGDSRTVPTPGSSREAYFYFDSTSGVTLVRFAGDPTASTPTPNVVSGAYIIIADDESSPAGGTAAPVITGRICRIGNLVPASAIPPGFSPPNTFYGPTFQLQPGSDFTAGDFGVLTNLAIAAPATTHVAGTAAAFTASIQAFTWVIGRAPTLTPGTASEYTGPFSGPNQDIGVATGYVRINTSNN